MQRFSKFRYLKRLIKLHRDTHVRLSFKGKGYKAAREREYKQASGVQETSVHEPPKVFICTVCLTSNHKEIFVQGILLNLWKGSKQKFPLGILCPTDYANKPG